MKKIAALFSVLAALIGVVMSLVVSTGTEHVAASETVHELKTKNDSLHRENKVLTNVNQQLTEEVEILETTVNAYEEADSIRVNKYGDHWELQVPISE